VHAISLLSAFIPSSTVAPFLAAIVARRVAPVGGCRPQTVRRRRMHFQRNPCGPRFSFIVHGQDDRKDYHNIIIIIIIIVTIMSCHSYSAGRVTGVGGKTNEFSEKTVVARPHRIACIVTPSLSLAAVGNRALSSSYDRPDMQWSHNIIIIITTRQL